MTHLAALITILPILMASNRAPVEVTPPAEIPPVPAGRLGVGAAVPAVTVRNAEDREVSLREAIGGKPTVLIFYRGGWCPFCTRHMGALGAIQEGLAEAGVQVIGLSPDRPAKLRENPILKESAYTLLSDSLMHAAKAFGIAFQVPAELVETYKTEYGIDLEGDSGQTHHLLPRPAVYVVDRQGVIQFAHVNEDYKVRMDPDAVLEAARNVAE